MIETGVIKPRLLVVEDDRELSDMLARLLTASGYHVDVAEDGHNGLHKALTSGYDGLVIDRGLPAIEGLDLVRRLRKRGVLTPILVLTAYGSNLDVIAGLDAGAEDYLVKPFDIDVLLARVRALLRRRRSEQSSVAIGDATLDLSNRTVILGNGHEVELSGRETALLRVLALNPSRVFGREELKSRVFESAESDSIIDTYVHYLRRKLGNRVIETVRGLGYRAGRL